MSRAPLWCYERAAQRCIRAARFILRSTDADIMVVCAEHKTVQQRAGKVEAWVALTDEHRAVYMAALAAQEHCSFTRVAFARWECQTHRVQIDTSASGSGVLFEPVACPLAYFLDDITWEG